MSKRKTTTEQNTLVISRLDTHDEKPRSGARLVAVAGPELGSQFLLTGEMTVGRAADSDVRLSAPGVSRRHCLIRAVDDDFEIEDLNSTNHTWINDVAVERQLLADGDRIRLGKSVLKYIAADSPDAAYHDDLAASPERDTTTGLLRIGPLQRRLDGLLEQASTSPEAGTGGVMVIAVDRASQVRERIGISGTGPLLAAIAERIAPAPGADTAVARYGEFNLAILVAGTTQALEQLAGEYCTAIARKPFAIDNNELAITVSIGTCAFDLRLGDAEAMLVGAVRAAEQAQDAGGRRCHAYRPRISTAGADESERVLMALMQDALRRNTVQVLYQPAVSTRDSDTAHYQLLPRLLSEDDQLIPAAQFVPAAERAGKVRELDLWISVRAIKVLDEQLNQGRSLRLFVSQSGASLDDKLRFETLAKRLRPEICDQRLLVFEFAYQDLMERLKSARQLLPRLRDLGLGVSIGGVDERVRPADLLAQLPADYIKLGGDFARAVSRDQAQADVFRRMAEQAHAADARVIVPMVEDAETMGRLWTSAADLLQGNFIQQPMQTPDFSL